MPANNIQAWKNHCEAMLPPEDQVVQRNKAITSIYAQLYWSNPKQFKWAGMAAFASHHISIGLLPFKMGGIKKLDVETSCANRGLVNDLNLIRHLNNRIFDDIGWVHFAYRDHGLVLLRALMTGHPHYQNMLDAFETLEQGMIWEANTHLLRHEQEFVVQPVFDQLGATFQNILTFCASLDFNPSHSKTDWKYHSSFVIYMYLYGKQLMFATKSLPNLTILKQRWEWLERKIVSNWRRNEANDPSLAQKFQTLIGLFPQQHS